MTVFDCQNVAYQLPKKLGGKTLIHSLSWQLKSDQCVAIVGESGAGKSTFLKCLNGLLTPTSGTILFAGKPIDYQDKAAMRNLRSNIGMVFQTPILLNTKTLFDNVALPLTLQNMAPDEIKKRVMHSLKQVGLEDRAWAAPSDLSGGQKQRAAIAMALITKPKVLLCDEPTSALDAHSAGEILTLIEKLHKSEKIPVVMISHDLKTVQKIASHIAILHKGQLVETGPIDEVLMNPTSPQTRLWLESYFTATLPPSLQKQLATQTQTLLHLRFYQSMTFQPVLAETIKTFNLDISILQARIEMFHTTVIGTMIVGIMTPRPPLKRLLAHLKKAGIIADVYNKDNVS